MSDPSSPEHRKNRFRLEPGEAGLNSSPSAGTAGRRLHDASGDAVFIDDPDPRHASRMRFRYFLMGGLALLAIVAGLALYYFLGTGAEGDAANGQPREFQRVGEQLKDEYYIPTDNVSAELARAIGLYRAAERDGAKRAFQKFISDDNADAEKAIAAVFLGVMAVEVDRLSEAKQQFVRALRYNRESVAALVNLALVERRLGNHADAQQYARQARGLAPGNRNVALVLGNILNESQDVDGAIDTYREGLANAPDDPLLLYNTGLSLLRQNKYEEALLEFSKAHAAGLAGRGTSAGSAYAGGIAVQARAHMGQIYFRQGNLEMAADALSDVVRLAPDNGKYRYNLGVVYLRLNRPRDALAEFRLALEAGTNEAQVYRALAQAFQSPELNQPALAIRALEKGLYLRPDDIETLFQLGDLYYTQSDFLPAARSFAKIVNITPGDANTEAAYLRLAQVYSQMERHNDAIDVLEKAAAINPQNRRIYYQLGQVYERAGRRDLAVQNWERALRDADSATGNSAPGASGSRLEREDERAIRLAMARVYRGDGAHELALRQYRRIRERNSEVPAIESDPELDQEIGLSYMALKNYPNAIASFEAVAAAPSATETMRRNAFVQIAAAQAESETGADLESARANINKAVRLDPADAEARMLQAYILMKTRSMVDREKAVEILRAVTRSDIDAQAASKAHNLLGLAYMDSSEYRRALASFEQAVRLDPGNTDAYRNQRAAANAYEKNL